MKISVIIPAHNEGKVIEKVVLEIHSQLKKESIDHEIVVVNDNSSDHTPQVINELERRFKQVKAIHRQPPNGLGRAVRDGIEKASGDCVAVVMGDASDDPGDIVKYYRKIEEGYDCVFGSRFIKGAVVKDYPRLKLFVNRMANLFLQCLFLSRHNDLTNAFKAYRSDVIKAIKPIESAFFNITVELPLKALIRNYRIATVPINWYGRQSGVSKLKISEMGRKYLYTSLSIWLQYLSRKLKHKHNLVWLIIALAALIRLYNINGSMFDYNPLRQAVNAAITRNFITSPDANLFLPELDNMGRGPAYFMFELPILQYLIAQFAKIAGLHNWVFRFPSVIFFILSAFYFYKLIFKLFQKRIALASLIFYCVAPMSILMSRVFQIDSFMFFCMLFSVYHALKWIENGALRSLVFATMGLTVFLLCKFPNAYILLFIYSLFFIYRKPSLAFRFVLPTLIILAVNIWWWIIYSGPVRSIYPNEYTHVQGTSVFTFSHVPFIMRQYSLNLQYWLMLLKQSFIEGFSPPVFILFFLGLFARIESRARAILFSWLASVLVFFAFVPGASAQVYYKLHLIPAGSVFAAIGYLGLVGRIKRRRLKRPAVIGIWAAILVSGFLIVYPIIRHKPVFENQQLLGERVQELTNKDDLVVASFGPDSLLLYYCDRKGWNHYLLSGKDNIRYLEERRKDGAAFFVCGSLDEFEHDSKFKDYVVNRYLLKDYYERTFSLPKKYTLDYFLWLLSGRRKEFERQSLGYVIFDLRNKVRVR